MATVETRVAPRLREISLHPSRPVRDSVTGKWCSFRYVKRELIIVIDGVDHATQRRSDRKTYVIDHRAQVVCMVEERSERDVLLRFA